MRWLFHLALGDLGTAISGGIHAPGIKAPANFPEPERTKTTCGLLITTTIFTLNNKNDSYFRFRFQTKRKYRPLTQWIVTENDFGMNTWTEHRKGGTRKKERVEKVMDVKLVALVLLNVVIYANKRWNIAYWNVCKELQCVHFRDCNHNTI